MRHTFLISFRCFHHSSRVPRLLSLGSPRCRVAVTDFYWNFNKNERNIDNFCSGARLALGRLLTSVEPATEMPHAKEQNKDNQLKRERNSIAIICILPLRSLYCILSAAHQRSSQYFHQRCRIGRHKNG